MKKVLAITLMLLLLATAAMCAENNWRVALKTDNGAGMAPNTGIQVGVYPTSVEGLDAQDGSVYGGIGADTPGTATHIAAVVPGMADVYGKSLKAATQPVPEKVWDFFVAGNVNYAYPQIRVRLFTVGSTSLPPLAFAGMPVKYAIRLLDNKAVEGAPANNTVWFFDTPVTHSTTVPVWETTLPMIKLSTKANAALIGEGYKFQLVQMPVPEPSSLLALGTGLVGLVGFVSRRRRA